MSGVRATVKTRKKYSLKEFTRVLEESVFPAVVAEAQAIGVEMRDDIRRRIEEQEFDHVPLDPEYKRSKERKGLDERILIATKDYLNGITTDVVMDGQRAEIQVGVEDREHEPSGLPLHKLAAIHEFGTSTIPARPVWRPMGIRMEAQRRAVLKRLNAAKDNAFREDMKR